MRGRLLAGGLALVACLGALYASSGSSAVGTRVPRGTRYGGRAWPNPRTAARVPFLDIDGQQFVATAADECTGVTPTSQDGGVIVLVRAGSVWCTKTDYSLVALGANKLRIQSDRGTTPHFGPFKEGRATTNYVTSNRDLTHEWTATNGTAARATGADSIASSGSSFTATSANATIAQAITFASAAGNGSLYIKRLAGSGAVSVSRDNGSTYTAITSSLSSSIFKRVVSMETESAKYGGSIQVTALAAVGSNPTLKILLAVSGDAVAIDLAQFEADYFPSSPITNGVSENNTRAAEGPYVDVTSMTPQVVAWSISRTGFGPGADFVWSLYNDASNRVVPYDSKGYSIMAEFGGNSCFWASSGGSQIPTPAFFVPTMGPVPMRCSNDGSTLISNVNGGIVSVAETTAPPSGVTRVYIGGGPGGTSGNEILTDGCIKSAAANCTIPTNRAPNAVAWIGDSTIGCNNPATAGVCPASNLQKLLGRTVYNWAIPGTDCASARSVYETNIRGRGFRTLIVSCGTNDVAGSGGTNTASVIATLTALYDEVRADGLTLIPGNILPRGNSAGWTGGMATSLAAINAFTAAYCVSHSLNCLDGYSAMGGQGGDPTMPLDAEFATDHVHPDVNGSAHLATLAYAAHPRHWLGVLRPSFRPPHRHRRDQLSTHGVELRAVQ